ncbi:peptide chain release factor N(5)-glutamine methyltransferase [Lentisalinibacter orientalis]|uniref:peptide chain release factor N(5)-glutamine methyltransferase n=1 Tax=Lentisalinibacter orientalis TaxID=2992241 RepID=UPI0038692C62
MNERMHNGADDIGGWLRRARAALADVSDSPALDAELLLARALGRDRSWLIAHRDDTPAAGAKAQADAWLARRLTGEPLAYITGTREFWSLAFEVTPAVLIPRPDTEILVERALELIPRGERCRVLDLGTGSGAIAVAIASERPAAEVTATDASAEALAVARRNAARLVPGRVRFVVSDWFTALGSERCDLIVSNPPYVAQDDPALADAALGFEPRRALTAGADGLDEIRRIAAGLPAHLTPGGRALIEHGAMQAAGVAGILRAVGLEVVACRRDLAGADRVTEARLPDA